MPRANCYSCMRPLIHCLCSDLQPFQMHCNLLIVQHPSERKKYHNTAKLCAGSIVNSQLIRTECFDTHLLDQTLSPESTFLLYPGSEATYCQEIELDQNSTLVVLDGTWSQANKLLRNSPELQGLKQVSFSQSYLSRYRIRVQPKKQCLSTIEAVAYFLLESSIKLKKDMRLQRANQAYHLLDLFKQLVERQLACWKSWEPDQKQIEQGIVREQDVLTLLSPFFTQEELQEISQQVQSICIKPSGALPGFMSK